MNLKKRISAMLEWKLLNKLTLTQRYCVAASTLENWIAQGVICARRECGKLVFDAEDCHRRLFSQKQSNRPVHESGNNKNASLKLRGITTEEQCKFGGHRVNASTDIKDPLTSQERSCPLFGLTAIFNSATFGNYIQEDIYPDPPAGTWLALYFTPSSHLVEARDYAQVQIFLHALPFALTPRVKTEKSTTHHKGN